MFRYHPLPSYLLLLIVILATSGHAACLCRQDQSAALLRLKGTFLYDISNFLWCEGRNLSSWKVDTNCCTWEGVTCEGTSGYVTALDLSDRCISGNLSSSEIFKLTSLRFLSLADNNFDASPWPSHGFEQLTDLEYLDLSYSGLSGALPVENGQLSNLVSLDLSGLDLKDLKLETLINNLANLQSLYLVQVNISVLDLSSNSFNSSIPPRFLKQFKAMMTVSSGAPSTYVGIIAPSASTSASALSPSYFPYYKESITVTLKGQETTLVQILSIFMYLDLSNNNFEGIIPNEIGDLKLLKQLNLSRNSFTRGIPPQIANILQLETLDLSFNHLSGEIPPEMAKMSFLEVLNLSYNNLSGMIPQSSQFLTFPNTSFLGNDGLCGKPLTRQCDTNQAPSAAATPDSSKELNWEFLSVEIGVVSGLVITFVTMLLWGNGKRWVYWHVDKFWLQVLQPWICHCLR
nr:unnamed protein product [Digitaria exilis]